MAEHEKGKRRKQEEVDRKSRIKQKESESLLDQVNTWGQDKLTVGETPFKPPVESHAAMLAKARQGPQRANLVLRLQRTYGNAYVQRLLESHAVQAKLTVSQPDDIYEQEAERVSEIVTREINTQVKGQDEEEQEETRSGSLLQRQEEEELEVTQSRSQLQSQEEEEEETGTKLFIKRQDEEEQEETASISHLQRQSALVAEDLETHIEKEKGNGQSLSDGIREPMERVFGADFSSVKVHTDTEADVMNRQLNARAFTTGQDIFFREGEYSPGSGVGQKLIAHELTHVVQQGKAGISPQQLKKMELAQTDSAKRQEEEEGGSEEGGGEEGGDIPDQELEEEEAVEKGPGEGQMFDAAALKSSTPTHIPDSDLSTQHKISVGSVNFEFSNSGTGTVDSSNRQESEESNKTVNIDWHNPGGRTVSPFGCEFFEPSYKNVNYTRSWLGNITLNFTIDVNCPWGTNDGGRKDVTSATDALITKDTYNDIVKDMTPFKYEKCWVAPFSKYWSKAIVERHEKLHSTDDKTWSEGPGKTVVTSYINGKPAPFWNVKDKLKTYLDNAMVEMRRANTAWYKGGAASYWSYAGEERAFGDGKAPLEELAAAVKKQGEKLTQEAQK
jgi:hypothetical protein